MYNPTVTVRRIDVLIRILNGRKTILSANYVRAYSSEGKVTIGDVAKEISEPKKAEYVPRKYCKYLIKFYNLNRCFLFITCLFLTVTLSTTRVRG